MAVGLWFAALCGLVVLAVRATTRARSSPDDVIARWPFVAVAFGHALVVAGAMWVWGGDLASEGHDAQLRRTPRVTLELRAPRGAGIGSSAPLATPPRTTVRAGDVLRIGRNDDPIPGLATWVVPPPSADRKATNADVPAQSTNADRKTASDAPASSDRKTANGAPTDGKASNADRKTASDAPATPASAALGAGSSEILAVPMDPTDCTAWPHGRASRRGCDVSIGGFELVAVPLVADPPAVFARNAHAAFAIGAPLVLVCIVLACLPRSRRRTGALSHVMRLAVVAGAFAALACWRLTWAYRIDVLRDLAPDGSRIADNLLAAALIGATLAGLAIRRAGFAVLAWFGWLVVTWLMLGLGPAHVTTARAAMVALSLVAVFAPRANALALARITPDLVLGAIAGAALVARTVAPHGVLVKLALAYALVLAGHAALRDAFAGTRRVRSAIALGAAGLALAAYDTGVTVAIGGIGLALAMLVAYHDAIYDESRADRIGILEREHARLVAVHGAVAVLLAGAAIIAAYVVGDRTWLARGADVACHAPLVAAALFVFGAVFAHTHRRAWLPHALAALTALAMWGARGQVLERATAGHGVISDRVAAIVDPGYALLHDGHRFAATASAWREATLPETTEIDRWHGEGLFGARIVDPGVVHSVENDYLPVLVAREAGIGGIAQTTLLVLLLVGAAGALANVAHRNASRAHRARWLVAVVLGSLAIYQPLASLGVLPLTGISWPGLGIDSPSDLWLFVIAIAWCALGRDDEREPSTRARTDDDRVRSTPRVVRAHRIALAAIATTACAGGIVVARSAAVALARVPTDDARIAAALDYGATVACPWHRQNGALATLVPEMLGGTPTDAGTSRFDRELRAAWAIDRSEVIGALESCHPSAGHWRLTKTGDTCTAVFRAGGPEVRLAITAGKSATCTVATDDEPAIALRGRTSIARSRIRVVSAPIGSAAIDRAELVLGAKIIRLRAGSPVLDLAGAAAGLSRASSVALGGGVTIDATKDRLAVHGEADLFAFDAGAWRRIAPAEVKDRTTGREIDRLSLVVAGRELRRIAVLIRPVAEPLLADDVERDRRMYPYGAALPELGWVNRFDADHSLGLDGWIHVALSRPAKAAPACGTLVPPAIARDQVCSKSRLDGVLECKLALQPELVLALDAIADGLAAQKSSVPTRIAYVVLRGDTGEVLAQSSRVPGREPLAYAPANRAAEAELVKLREQHGESDRERVEWNLPIAVGSTFKAIVARAAELSFPDELHHLTLTAAGHASGCKSHRGMSVDPLLGHCPPSSLAGDPTSTDVHDFLARSPNWFQAALGIVGLALPKGTMSTKAGPLSFAEVARTDLASWPTSKPLAIADANGPIIDGHRVVLAGLRRTPLWTRIEQLLGRPLCTLGDRATCVSAADRADVCAARALPIDAPSRDLRYLVALGPDRLELYDGDRPDQLRIPVREYFQLLRGAGAHPIGSLLQLADAFSRVIYDPTGRLAASWFPAPAVGTAPKWSCSDPDRTTTVVGAGGGLCAVVREGTASKALATMLADKRVAIYGAKTGTTDSLAEVARRPAACAAWNANHPAPLQLVCGKRPPDDSLFVIAFGVVTAKGTIPITLAIQLQRGGSGSAARATPALMSAIAAYLRAE